MNALVPNLVYYEGGAPMPPVDTARLPQSYEHAKQALAACSKLDECQTWADKAEALASYARQAGDDSLRKMADRIQARAIRRAGELLKQIEPGKTGPKTELREGTLPQLNRTQAAEDAGISEWQRKTMLRVANVPEEVFEDTIESESPPTVTQLAELGKQSKPVTPLYDLEGIDPEVFKQATAFMGMVGRLKKFCGEHDPLTIAQGIKPWERVIVKSDFNQIEPWLDRFIVNL